MKNRERKQERLLKDPLPVRLADLAADLGAGGFIGVDRPGSAYAALRAGK